MKAYKLRENIWWVGGIDWDLRSFHGYLTQRGSTYNAYLIIDEKVTLIDNVKYYLYDEMLARISDVIDPAKIDIIVQNHVEMDHSSGLPMLMKLIPNAKIYTNASGIRGLKMHYGQDWNFEEIKSGDSINIGKRDLSFLTTPMVHWPDNQVTYCPQEKILFSNDAFGQHIASSERLATDYPFSIAMEEAKKVLCQHRAALFLTGAQSPGSGFPTRYRDDRSQSRPHLDRTHSPNPCCLHGLGKQRGRSPARPDNL